MGSGVSLPSLARALEAIRRLVAIGALDGALIGAASGGAADYAGVSGRVKALPRGKSPNVFEVKTPAEMNNLFNELSRGGSPVTSSYKGTMVQLPDGTKVGMRATSKSGGSTIDVFSPDGSTAYKVHLP